MISIRVSVTSDDWFLVNPIWSSNGLDDFSFGQCHEALQYVWGQCRREDRMNVPDGNQFVNDSN